MARSRTILMCVAAALSLGACRAPAQPAGTEASTSRLNVTSTSLAVTADAEAHPIPIQRVTVIDAGTVNVNVLVPSCEQLDAVNVTAQPSGWNVTATAITVGECTDADTVTSVNINAGMGGTWDGRPFYDTATGTEIAQ